MKILFLTSGDFNTEPIINSLESIKQPHWEIYTYNYVKDSFNFLTLTGYYDAIIYISVSSGPHLPSIETLKFIKDGCHKFIHLCFDAADINWHSLLYEYAQEKVFTKTINIDGNHDWPHGQNDITTLAPIDPRPFEKYRNLTKDIEFGFCGGWESEPRRAIISSLRDKEGLVVKSKIYDNFTYEEYAKFLCKCKKTINIPQSGSGNYQIKARVIEAGLANCTLLEYMNPLLKIWFPQTKQISHFDEVSASYLHHEVTTKYTPQIFWDRALS